MCEARRRYPLLPLAEPEVDLRITDRQRWHDPEFAAHAGNSTTFMPSPGPRMAIVAVQRHARNSLDTTRRHFAGLARVLCSNCSIAGWFVESIPYAGAGDVANRDESQATTVRPGRASPGPMLP